MNPVTQLYVSIDASTKESLKKIDRPLFKDYWERFMDSLKALCEKVQYIVDTAVHHIFFNYKFTLITFFSRVKELCTD